VLSCQRTFLPAADAVIEQAERAQGRPLASIPARVVLSGQSIDLMFADESAKVDVNLLVQRQGKAQAEAAVKSLVRRSGVNVRAKLLAGAPRKARPADPDRDAPSHDTVNDDADDDGDYRPLQSFGQVFPDAPPERLAGTSGRPGASRDVTCWGDGVLHFNRASADALRQVCLPRLGAARTNRLLRLREQSPAMRVDEALAALQLNERLEDEMADVLGEESTCQSLWVVAGGGGRSWYHFAVLDRAGGGAGATMAFAW
jgi:hypothetical protein